MKRKLIVLAGAMTLLPTIALADYCRDCRSDGYHSDQGHSHQLRHDHANDAWSTSERKHWKQHKKQHKKQHRKYHRRKAAEKRLGYGRVVDVEPVYRYYTQTHSYDSCVQREVSHSDYRRNRNWAPTVFGAVLGTAVGHRIGDSHGDADVAALAGGVLGAAIGHDVSQRNHTRMDYTVRGPCRETRHRDYQRKSVEYVVTYRYNGQVYRTNMDHHPGEWVELDVKVKPV